MSREVCFAYDKPSGHICDLDKDHEGKHKCNLCQETYTEEDTHESP